MRRLTLSLLALAVLALVALGGASTASAKTCSPAKYPPGKGYFTSLEVHGTSCAAGRTVQKHHYSCRIHNGGKNGRCNKRVDGYSCSERRPASGRTSDEFNARVTCKKGSRKIVFTYQQNL